VEYRHVRAGRQVDADLVARALADIVLGETLPHLSRAHTYDAVVAEVAVSVASEYFHRQRPLFQRIRRTVQRSGRNVA
jgi:hypothetical protein